MNRCRLAFQQHGRGYTAFAPRKWGVEPPAYEHLAAGIYEARDWAQR